MSDLAPAGAPRPLATLARAAGPRAGEALAVARPVATLGRAASCDVVVDDDSVSDRHARLAYEAGAWTLTDLGSTNGTAVEGARLEPNVPAPLPYGAALRLGGVRLRFEEAAGADPDAARAAYVEPETPRTLREERRGPRFPVWLLVELAELAAVIAIVVYILVAAPAPPDVVAASAGLAEWLPAAAAPLS
jgi:hypothetical protein